MRSGVCGNVRTVYRSLVLTGYADSTQFGAIWLTWWLGDAAGALIVTPLLVLWGTTRSLGPLRERPAESILLLLVVVATGALVFMYPGLNRYPLPFLCIPALVWAAFRFGPREVATGVAILSAIADSRLMRIKERPGAANTVRSTYFMELGDDAEKNCRKRLPGSARRWRDRR